MRIIPAIDLRAGRCVRLVQGDYDRQLDYGGDPAELARSYAAQGAELIHVVDLDGARDGDRSNRRVAGKIVAAAGVAVELGGGIRTADDVAEVLEGGAAWAIVGTLAAERPDSLAELTARFGDRIVLGLDVSDGFVAVRGWRKKSKLTAHRLARIAVEAGVSRAVYTDVSRDGMLQGPDHEGAVELQDATGLRVTASGGVGSLAHVRAAAAAGADSLIVGRALFEGRFTVAQAIEAARDNP